MQLAESDHCTGCGACKAICPKEAISFFEDNEGFPTPSIDTNMCIECGLCNKLCPAIHIPETHQIRDVYAAQILDKEALLQSSSGGLFTAFARETFKRNGIVYGCIWDDQYNAVIRKAENEEETKPMRGSKYVWSWVGDCYQEIKAYLESGRTVMFTGLPCQVAGLKSYLQKDYEKLFLMTFFCGGAPSPYAYHKYLETITKKIPMVELDFKFRDKEEHGTGVHISYETKHGKKHQSYIQNPFFFSYHTKVFHRKCCYHCQYRFKERIEDITIGDYWTVRKYHPDMDSYAGVSALLVNTEKGERLFEQVKGQMILRDTKIEYIAEYNNISLTNEKKEYQIPEFREAFFNKLNEKGWAAAERKYLYNKQRIKLLILTKLPQRSKQLIRKVLRF